MWPAFREFVGRDLLVAHNGHTFDVPVLRRIAAGKNGDGLAIAGLVLGWLGIVLGIALVALMLVLFGGLAWLSAWG